MFENQVSLEKTRSAVKNESDAVVKIRVPQCRGRSKNFCQKIGLTVGETTEKKLLLIKQTLRAQVNCPDMQFEEFPFDIQSCGFLLKDLKLTENRFRAKNNFKWLQPILEKGKTLTSTEYDLELKNASLTGLNRSRCGFQVEMVRKTGVYIYTYFVPSGLMVIVSWVSFAVRVDAVPGRLAIVNVDPVPLIRLGLLLTLLLMTINLNNSATGSIPTSDGICPLISWILISMVFILVALVEYFLILVVLRFRDKVSENKSIHLFLVCLSEEKIWEGARQQKP